MVKIYTDGAQKDHVGAWAIVALEREAVEVRRGVKEGGSSCNNEIELFAVLKALYYIFEKDIKEALIVTDSEYITTGVEKAKEWRANNWRNKKGQLIKNRELWENVDNILTVMRKSKTYNVLFKKIKAHSNNAFNDKADREAREELNKHLGGHE